MKKVTYFDVEYANNKNKSICQIGLMCENYEDGEPVFPELNIYVNPEDGFDSICTQIHGICPDTVKNAPSFPCVWQRIEKYFTNSIIIGHNVANADLDALIKCLNRYNIDIPEIYYIDTLEIARNNIPSCYIQNYSMSSLCDYFEICIDNEHDAFDDACANADLLKALKKKYDIKVEYYVKRYIIHSTYDFVRFVSNPLIRRSISEFYGTVIGIIVDEKVNQKEYEYILKWKNANEKYISNIEINNIINVIDSIIADGIITNAEMKLLRNTIKCYIDTIECSPITLGTQILSGIIKGITCDNVITIDECENLKKWLYDNNYLRGHFPFDKIINTLEMVLEDNVITKEETAIMLSQLNELIDPVEALKGMITTVKNKTFCLSGNFAYGQKSAVNKIIIESGGIVEENIKKSTDYLIIGAFECEAYSNGKYGTKVKKAIEYNQKGSDIIILKETDFFKSIK